MPTQPTRLQPRPDAMTPHAFRCDEGLWESVQYLAGHYRVAPSDVIRDALAQYVADFERWSGPTKGTDA